ncbi:hypothetical protein [Vibrio sp. 10N.261.54.E10]
MSWPETLLVEPSAEVEVVSDKPLLGFPEPVKMPEIPAITYHFAIF